MGLIPRLAESVFNFTNGHRLVKYAKLNPPQNIRRIRYSHSLVDSVHCAHTKSLVDSVHCAHTKSHIMNDTHSNMV